MGQLEDLKMFISLGKDNQLKIIYKERRNNPTIFIKEVNWIICDL